MCSSSRIQCTTLAGLDNREREMFATSMDLHATSYGLRQHVEYLENNMPPAIGKDGGH